MREGLVDTRAQGPPWKIHDSSGIAKRYKALLHVEDSKPASYKRIAVGMKSRIGAREQPSK